MSEAVGGLEKAAYLLRLAYSWDDPADIYEAPELLREACKVLRPAIVDAVPRSRARRRAKAALAWCQFEPAHPSLYDWREMRAHADALDLGNRPGRRPNRVLREASPASIDCMVGSLTFRKNSLLM